MPLTPELFLPLLLAERRKLDEQIKRCRELVPATEQQATPRCLAILTTLPHRGKQCRWPAVVDGYCRFHGGRGGDSEENNQ
jgi:hypothetical protein